MRETLETEDPRTMRMFIRRRHVRACVLLVGTGLLAAGGSTRAQQRPVAAMFGDDQRRGETVALSFATAELPSTARADSPAQIYLTAGDLERAFDTAGFRPDGAIVPTNTDLQITAASPATQRVLVERVQKQSGVMRELQNQIAARRKQSAAASTGQGVLGIGVDSFFAQLVPQGTRGSGAFPNAVCLVATDFAKGGAIDRRELFAQERVRKGIAGCLAALEASGAQSVVVPLMGAASSGLQATDPAFEGQRILKECRFLNSVAGIALGIHDFAPQRRRIREIGIIQWDRELEEMFSLPKGTRLAQTAQNAYRTYADQVKLALRKGLAGEPTTSSDVDGSCTAILNAR
jgi:hypothetical protein